MNEDFYAGTDPVDLPRYGYRDASRATGVAASTIGAWFRGQHYYSGEKVGYFKPVLQRPYPDDPRLSFNNLLEVHVLAALRRVHEVRLNKVRDAISLAQQRFNVPRLLISNQLHTGGGELFLQTYSDLVHLNKSEQTVMTKVFEQFLQRISVDTAHADLLPFYPFSRSPERSLEKLILVSPFVSFGAAIISSNGASTATIARRVKAGEEKAAIVGDYGLKDEEFDEAVLYEAAA